MALISAFDDDFFGPLMGHWPMLDTGRQSRGQSGAQWKRTMPLDIVEHEKAFELKADVPGVDKNDIKLSVDGDVLSLKVERETHKEDTKEVKGVKWHRNERSAMFASRSIRMPENADLSKITAKYSGGVLTLDIPKDEEKAKPRTIAIN